MSGFEFDTITENDPKHFITKNPTSKMAHPGMICNRHHGFKAITPSL
jgi:hypothetical protein